MVTVKGRDQALAGFAIHMEVRMPHKVNCVSSHLRRVIQYNESAPVAHLQLA